MFSYIEYVPTSFKQFGTSVIMKAISAYGAHCR